MRKVFLPSLEIKLSLVTLKLRRFRLMKSVFVILDELMKGVSVKFI